MAENTGNAPDGAYRVLARKYRPQTFDDLIGQEPMVRTLSNAFKAGRIHQAYIFTGVRGIGKTTTARILARGLNYEPEEGGGGPTVDMPVLGRHCQEIIDSRHVDVIEMDAASNTGINDVREIIDGARYRPVSARYKVYIIDEVHMLSTQAFNGLLKTLEEPPEHVKFLFATTEIRKVPITVLSRCIRFDLRRIEMGRMIGHLSGICDKERVTIEPEALAAIARASEGSVRDALSLLDQAIAHAGAGSIAAEEVRLMLGLADRARIVDLFEAVMKGDMARALGEVKEQHDAGADPAVILTDLADYVHFVTRLKLVPSEARDGSVSETELTRGEAFAATLPMPVLTRAWQILLKGLQEVNGAARPLQAAEMVLVRLAYAADLPTPGDALRALKDGGAMARPAVPAPSSGPRGSSASAGRPVIASSNAQPAMAIHRDAAPGPHLTSIAEMAALAGEKRDITLKVALERDVRPVRLEPGVLEFALAPGGAPDLANRLSRALQDWTGQRWMVALSNQPGDPTLAEVEAAKQAEALRGVRADPTVRAILEAFPGAEIVAVRDNRPAEAAIDHDIDTAPEGADDPSYTEDDL